MDRNLGIAIGGAAFLLLLLGGIYLAGAFPGRSAVTLAQCRGGQVAGDLGGPFELVNGRGETVTDAEVITEPSILYFGYTFCPDVCPMDFARNAVAVDILEERGIAATPVFISVDPARDTPEVVADFAANNHERAIGLTGSPEQVAAASEAYKTYYRAQEDDGSGFYLLDHSAYSYLVLPEAGFVDFFGRDVTPEDMADRVQCYVEAAGA